MRWRVVGLGSFALAVLIPAASGNAAIAQTNATLKHLGILAPVYCPAPDWPSRGTVNLLQALAERGWIEGKTLIIHCLAPPDHIDHFPPPASALLPPNPHAL